MGWTVPFLIVNENTVIYSGGDKRRQCGVPVWLRQRGDRALVGYEPVNERMMVVRLRARPSNVTLMVCGLQLLQMKKSGISTTVWPEYLRKYLRMMFIAHGWFQCQGWIRKGQYRKHWTIWSWWYYRSGGFFGKDHELMVANTWFQHHCRRLYRPTWIDCTWS